MRGELRAVVGAAEDPQLRARRAGRMRLDRRERVAFVERLARYPGAQIVHLPREIVGGIRRAD